jgi:hypothetical protein
MKSCYSILKFVSNPLSDESIALGIVVVTDERVFFKISDAKIDFAKKLSPSCARLLDFSIKQLSEFADLDSCNSSDRIIKCEKRIKFDFLQRLSKYNNGLLQFSKPLSIGKDIADDLAFNSYFEKYIGTDIKSIKKDKKEYNSELKQNVQERLYEPLKDKIDVDFILKKDKLPTLYFDFHFDSIGVNGSMYAAKSIDLNSSRKLADIKSDISEYESVLERLNKFAEKKHINGLHEYYLIVDPYKGNVPSYNDLYSLLEKETMPYFKLINSNELDRVVKNVIKNNAHKFSEELADA